MNMFCIYNIMCYFCVANAKSYFNRTKEELKQIRYVLAFFISL